VAFFSSPSYSVSYDSKIDQATATALEVIQCESNFRPSVYGDLETPYPAYGIAQFQERTFIWLAKKSGRNNLVWKNPKDQFWLLTWAIKHNYGYLWTCWRKLQ
jgi:hypothetical protein